MKKLFMLIPLVILLCFTFCCQQGEEVAEIMSEQEKEDIARAVEERISDYFDAIKLIDIERILGFWADTEGFVFAGTNAYRTKKIISVKELMDSLLEEYENVSK